MKKSIIYLIVASMLLNTSFSVFSQNENSDLNENENITEIECVQITENENIEELEEVTDFSESFEEDKIEEEVNLNSWEGKQEKKTLLQENDFTSYDTDKTVPFKGGTEQTAGNAGMFFSGEGENDEEHSLGIDGSVSGTRVNSGAFALQSKGKILFEARVRSEGVSSASISFIGTNEAVRPGTTIVPKECADGKWHDVRYLVDLDAGTITFAYDGNEEKTIITGIVFSYGLSRFYIANWSANSGKVYIKNINVYQYISAPNLKSVIASNATGELSEFSEDASIPGGTNKLTLNFDDEISSAESDLFSIVNAKTQTEIEDYTVTVSGKTVVLSFENPLMGGTEYKLSVLSGIESKEGFTTENNYTFNLVTGLGSVIGELDSDVASPFESGFETLYENDFSTAEKVVADGVLIQKPGVYRNTGAYNFSTQEKAWENFGRLDFSLGNMHFSPEVVRISMDLKLSDYTNYNFTPFANTLDNSNVSVLLKNLPGVKTNDWMTVHFEFHPNPTPAKQTMNVWIDDNSVKSYTYQCGNRNNVSWLRLDGVSGTRYLRNLKIQSKRYWYENDCNKEAKVKVAVRESSDFSGFYNASMLNVYNNFEWDKKEKAVKATVTKGQTSGGLFNFGSGADTPLGKMKYSFKMKFTDEANVGLNLTWTTNDADSKTYSLMNDFIGEEFKKGVYQKYNVLVDNANKTVALWRGDELVMPETAVLNPFACGSRPGANAIRLYVTGACPNDAFIYLDDIVVERYDTTYVPQTISATSSKASIVNSTDYPFDAFLIYSTYKDSLFNGTKILKVNVPAYEKKEAVIEFEPGDDSVTDELVYLWSVNNLSPLNDYLRIKNDGDINTEIKDFKGAKIDYVNNKVIISGNSQQGSDVALMVFAPNKAFSDLTEEFNDHVVVYNRQLKADDLNGDYAVEFSLDRESGKYNYYIGTSENGEMVSDCFNYVSKADRSFIVSELNKAKGNPNAVKNACEENLFICGVDNSLFSRASSLIAANIISDYLENVNLFSENNFDELQNVVCGAFEISAIALGNGESSDYSESSKIYNILNKNIKKWMTNTTPTDKEKKNIIAKLKGSYNSISSFEEAFIENIILNVTQKHNGISNVKNVVADFENVIGVNTSKLSNSNYDNVLGKSYSSLNDFKQALTEEKSTKSSSGSTGGGSGGSSKGSFVSGGMSSNSDSVVIPVKSEEAPVTTTKIMSFTDLDSVSWALEAISALSREKIISGKSETVFDPNSNVKREEFTKMAVGVFGFKLNTYKGIFNDVPSNAWYKDYVATAVENGLCKGIGNGEFGTGTNITRQDLCVMVYNGLKNKPEIKEDTSFIDEESISDYAKNAVYALKSAGIINGNEKGEFNPKNSATRAEAAVILYAVLKYLK